MMPDTVALHVNNSTSSCLLLLGTELWLHLAGGQLRGIIIIIIIM
jgi:hypothetical protein